jgi:hypothetical protein
MASYIFQRRERKEIKRRSASFRFMLLDSNKLNTKPINTKKNLAVPWKRLRVNNPQWIRFGAIPSGAAYATHAHAIHKSATESLASWLTIVCAFE